MKGLRLPASIPHAPLPSRHGTAPCALVFRSRECQRPRPRAWDLVGRMVPAGDFGAERDGISQVPREPPCAFALLSDPGRTVPTKPIEWVDVAPVAMTTKAPATWPSFEAQSHGFCTHCLRFVPPLLTTTQDSLPAGGYPLPGGSGYPLGSVERFQTSTRHPPLLGLLGATRRRPLSATQQNPTTSLVGMSFHCNET
jgi:hypothetical protein